MDKFLCSKCDMNLTFDNCWNCGFHDWKWIFRFIYIKLVNLRDKIFNRNCLTCDIPINGFCEHLHIALLNQLIGSNELSCDCVCDQYKRKRKL
jgi:hypothetical protein